MTESITSLSFSYSVTNVTGKYVEFSCRQNVKKRIAKILYLENPPADYISLSYVGSQAITADNSLSIGDRSDRLYPNSHVRTGAEVYYENTNSVGIAHKNILVTQKFVVDTVSAPLPLYYKHVLPAEIDLDSIKIFDKNFDLVSGDKYLIEIKQEYDEATGMPTVPPAYTEVHVYNSLENYIDFETGEYEVYYIQYSNASNETVTELIENEQAYTEATIDDIWYVSLDLAPWCNAYIANKVGNSYSLRVPPTGQPFSVKYLADARISVQGPLYTDDESVWFPRITNGAFSWRYGSPTQYSYLYEIPEFEAQAFNPIAPYKFTDRVLCTKFTDNLFKLPHRKIGSAGYFIYPRFVIEKDGIAQYAITEDPLLLETRYKNIHGQDVVNDDGDYVIWSSDHLVSFDKREGIVQTDLQLRDYWEIYATYNYEETSLELASLNMNPVFDPDAHIQTRVLYIVPQAIVNLNSAQTVSAHWLKVDSLGLIEESNQIGSDGNININYDTILGDDDAYSIEGVLGLHYNWKVSTTLSADCTISYGSLAAVVDASLFPPIGWVRINDGLHWRYAKYDSKTDTSLSLTTDVDCFPSSGIDIIYDPVAPNSVELVNFIDEYTTMSVRDSSEEVDCFGLSAPYAPSCYRQYFILAEMTVNPPHGIQDLTVIDTRENGGGIPEDKYEEAKALNPEVQWYYENFKYSGQPYPGNAVAVIKLPASILSVYTQEFINEVIANNIPMGITPLVRYYGYKPQILSLVPGSESITVTWASMGIEFVYDIWYSLSLNGPWIKHNLVRVTDSIYETNTYVLDELDDDKVYYVRVTCHDKYDSWWCSYSDPESVEGGYSREDDPPEPPFGNNISFKFAVGA